jgi:hypothetical protein
MNHDYVCTTHRKSAEHDPDELEPCAWIPVEAAVGIGIVYSVECALCVNLQAGLYDSVHEALADRDAHLRSHRGGIYG